MQIKEILLDGNKNILPMDFFTLISWEVGQDGTLTWNAFKNRNAAIKVREKFSTLRIGLTKEEYSGIAKIYVGCCRFLHISFIITFFMEYGYSKDDFIYMWCRSRFYHQ